MDKKYTKEHEWILAVGDNWRVGITDFAQEQLGDVVMAELPEVGRNLTMGEECAVIESVKAASDIYSPAGGQVVAINDSLSDNPALVNESPEDEGWLWEMSLEDASIVDGLMDADAYAKFVEETQ